MDLKHAKEHVERRKGVPKTEDHVIAQILVNVASRHVDRTFDYLIPDHLHGKAQVGSRVIIPFGPRKVQGYILTIKNPTEQHQENLKAIEEVLDPYPPLTEELIDLGKWMSHEYICLLVSALEAMLPAALKSKTQKRVVTNTDGAERVVYQVKDRITTQKRSMVHATLSKVDMIKAKEQLNNRARKQKEVLEYIVAQWMDEKETISLPLQALLQACSTSRATVKALEAQQIIHMTQEEVRRDPYADQKFPSTSPLALTNEQQQAKDEMISSVTNGEHQPILLYGVTGSGKTEVYLQSISYVLDQGREAIVLVPEISLTPQMVERFKGRFGEQVAVIHSRLSNGERYDEWRKIREGKVKVAIGARSALFAPFKDIGLIIIDEEHESSYKQEESPKYHARDVAIFRGQYHAAPVVLGSATPTLESYARAQKGVYKLITLQHRVSDRALPKILTVDMRKELHAGNRSIFSRSLHEKIQDKLERKEQIVLFLNRRGYHTFVMCRDCGYVVQCPHCDISLTYHKTAHAYRCHYCGYTEGWKTSCPECESEHIRFFGSGTQRVEEELYKHFPGIRVIRMDVDTTQRKGAHEKLLKQFREQKADVLLGTQMIAKGLDFERVTLVGVIAADSLLHLPDFRSAEKTFQLLTQVSGRAGRHELPGEVVIQTYTPEHYSIQAASMHGYDAFFWHEMKQRKERGYPPYYYLSLITFTHHDLPFLVKICEETVTWIKSEVSAHTQVLGPVASPIPKIKDRYRYQCVIKYKDEPMLNHILRNVLDRNQTYIDKQQLMIQVDKNPQILM